MAWIDWTDCWERKHTHTATGYGIFARQDIHPGQPVFHVFPEIEANQYPVTGVNHSCIPNIFLRPEWDLYTGHLEHRYYAIREIEMGEELTRCYPSDSEILQENVTMRRSQLRTFFGFECLCLRCVGESSDVGWKSPEHWTPDFPVDLDQFLEGLVHRWKVQDEYIKLQKRDKARILAQRTVFSLRSFRDEVKSAVKKFGSINQTHKHSGSPGEPAVVKR